MTTDPDAPEIVNLLDVRGWADATILQITRIRKAWTDSYTHGAPLDSDDYDSLVMDVISVDVHFLLIATHQLIEARHRRLSVDLPTLSPDIERAVELLRPIREHYHREREAFFGGQMTPRLARLLKISPDAHPWGVSGGVAPAAGSDMVIADVLPIDQLDAEVSALLNAAGDACDEIARMIRGEQENPPR